ncbi:unnamed protein product, partial [Amoebophrya sp. A120]
PFPRVFRQVRRVSPHSCYLCVFRSADFEPDPIDEYAVSEESDGAAEELVAEVEALNDPDRQRLNYVARGSSGGKKEEVVPEIITSGGNRPAGKKKDDISMVQRVTNLVAEQDQNRHIEDTALRDILARPKKHNKAEMNHNFEESGPHVQTHKLLSQLHADLVVLGTLQRKMLHEQKEQQHQSASGSFVQQQRRTAGPKFDQKDLVNMGKEHDRMLSSWDPVEKRFWELQKAQMEQLNRDMFLAPDGILAEADVSSGGQIRTLGRFEFDVPYRVLEQRKDAFLGAVQNEMAEFAACHRDHVELLLTSGERPLQPEEVTQFVDKTGGHEKSTNKVDQQAKKTKLIPLLHVRGPARFLNCERFQEHEASVKNNRLFRPEVCTFLPDPLAKLDLGSGAARVLANENVRLRDRLSDVTNHAYYLEIFQKLCGQYEKAIDALRLKDEVLPELRRLQPVLVRDANQGRERPSQILQKLFRQGVVGMPDWIDDRPQVVAGESPAGFADAVPSGLRKAGGAPQSTAAGAAGGSSSSSSTGAQAQAQQGQNEADTQSGAVAQAFNERRAERRRVPGSTKLESNDLGSRYETVGDLLGDDEEKCFVFAVYLRGASNVPQADVLTLSDPYIQVRLRLRDPEKKEDTSGTEQQPLVPGDPAPPGNSETFHYISPSADVLDTDDFQLLRFANKRAIGNTRALDDTEFPEWSEVVEIEVREMELRFQELKCELVLLDANGVFSVSDTPIGTVEFSLKDYCEGPAELLEYDNGVRVRTGVGRRLMKGLFGGRGSSSKDKSGDSMRPLSIENDPSIADPTLSYAETPGLLHRNYKLHTLNIQPLIVPDPDTGRPMVDKQFELERCKVQFCCMWSVQGVREREMRKKAAGGQGLFQRISASLSEMFTGAAEGGV